MFNLRNNIGQKIMNFSTVLLVLAFVIAPSGIAVGIVMLFAEPAIALIILISSVCYGIGLYLTSLLICGFGQLVEDIHRPYAEEYAMQCEESENDKALKDFIDSIQNKNQ